MQAKGFCGAGDGNRTGTISLDDVAAADLRPLPHAFFLVLSRFRRSAVARWIPRFSSLRHAGGTESVRRGEPGSIRAGRCGEQGGVVRREARGDAGGRGVAYHGRQLGPRLQDLPPRAGRRVRAGLGWAGGAPGQLEVPVPAGADRDRGSASCGGRRSPDRRRARALALDGLAGAAPQTPQGAAGTARLRRISAPLPAGTARIGVASTPTTSCGP
jgi:hypothetical protein